MKLFTIKTRRHHRWIRDAVGSTCVRCGDRRRVEDGPKGGRRFVYDYDGGGGGPRRDCDRRQVSFPAAPRS